MRWTYSRDTDLSYCGESELAKAIAADLSKTLPFTIEGAPAANTKLTIRRHTGEQQHAAGR